jgi:membrane protease YdiL (CAAX protease family)
VTADARSTQGAPPQRSGIIAPLGLFLLLYVSTLALLTWSLAPLTVAEMQWSALAAAIVANAGANYRFDRRRWDYGLRLPPLQWIANLAGGFFIALIVVGCADLLIMTLTKTSRLPGGGIPWLSIAIVFTPAVFHEELLFRGYAYQTLTRWSRAWGMAISSLFFAALHLGNAHVGAIALLNIFIAGLLLSALYEVTRSLWLPIAAHWLWNIFSGPVLGHEVSGYEESALFRTVDSGPALLTGGEFGIEASLLMTAVEAVALFLVARRLIQSRFHASKQHSDKIESKEMIEA